MARVIITHPGEPASVVPPGQILTNPTGMVMPVSESALFIIAFCIAMSALLAVLALGCDKDGRFRAK